MEIFQELTFTAFLAIVFFFVVAKLLSFQVSSTSNEDNTAICSVTESSMETEAISHSGLGVKSTKGKKRVKFVDDFEVKRVDRFDTENGSESVVFLDDEEKSEGENICKRVHQSEDMGINHGCEMKSSKEKNFEVRKIDEADAQYKKSEIIEILSEKSCENDEVDEVLGEKEKTYVTNGVKSLITEEQKSELISECDDSVIDQKMENGVVGSGEHEGLRREDGVDEDDDWEGIERSELERVFAEAVNFVEYGGKGKVKDDDRLAKLDNDVKLQLYGLHKVAVEGPCHHAQPMALLVSSRAKWNAWQNLGSMNREEAMEKYIKILSDCIPTWMQECSTLDDTQVSSKFETTSDTGSLLSHLLEDKMKLKLNDFRDYSIGLTYAEMVKD